MERLPQLDLFVVDELGFLGQSQDGEGYVLNGDSYYFERSERGRLIVTSLFNRVQPLLRIETQDIVGPLGGATVEVGHSSSPMC
jgi:phenylacetate-coenzyme A ligase PaaK-like adenylate-forming protein